MKTFRLFSWQLCNVYNYIITVLSTFVLFSSECVRDDTKKHLKHSFCCRLALLLTFFYIAANKKYLTKILIIFSCSDQNRGLPHSTAQEETNEDLIQSCSDKSRGLPQTFHSTEQCVFSSECVRVDTNLNVHEDIQVLFSWQLCNVYIITVLCRFVFRLTMFYGWRF